MGFFNAGGGMGILGEAGAALPIRQHPQIRPLGLTEQQQSDLLVFLREGLLDRTQPLTDD